MVYFHRYIRLTPIVAITILFSSTLLWRLGDGPLWHTLINGGISCETTWWSALLYIQNYYNPERIVSSGFFSLSLTALQCFSLQCLGHLWYLSVDMQLFLVAPALAYAFYKFRSKALPIPILLIAVSIGSTVYLYIKHELIAQIANPE